jgi:hypothetical protein
MTDFEFRGCWPDWSPGDPDDWEHWHIVLHGSEAGDTLDDPEDVKWVLDKAGLNPYTLRDEIERLRAYIAARDGGELSALLAELMLAELNEARELIKTLRAERDKLETRLLELLDREGAQ